MPSKFTDWSTGAPPCAGWWNASIDRDPKVRRYWGGRLWSAPCYVGDPDEIADRAQWTLGETQEGISWRGLRRQP